VDNNQMLAAGVKKAAKEGQRGISDVWALGQRASAAEAPAARGILATKDINGAVKRNMYGQVIAMPDKAAPGGYHGAMKQKPDNFGSNYERIVVNQSSKNRS
jgi:hypothetical protein